ncbi:hypothetical protein ACHQM5_014080 [Ranunculus cassubicifolius]
MFKPFQGWASSGLWLCGYGRSEGRCLLCLRTSSIAAVPSYSYRGKRTVLICSANSSNHRRNPDFSRQSRPNSNFSRNKNRPNTERPENFEDSDYLTSKNGPLLSLSNSPRYQATPTPGPREKEIVELFRKVQAQLRSRAAIKEEKKLDTSQGQGKETETVDSLLKLLRKHSVDQGKRRTRAPNGDFGFDQSEPNNSYGEEHNTNFFESNTKEETNTNPFRRPTSNFRKRSPVPRIKYQPVYSVEEEKKPISEPEAEIALESDSETEHDPDLEPYVAASDVHEDDDEEFDVMSESDSDTEEVLESDSEVEFSDLGEVVEKPPVKQETDLSALKLPELRVLAKARGVKGFYKLKKAELLALLSGEESV